MNYNPTYKSIRNKLSICVLSFFFLLFSTISYAGDYELGPCSKGFWKNRAADKNGLLKYYPDTIFTDLLQKAADSSTVFSTPQEVKDALLAKGNTDEQRALQQTAALLMNLAAGENTSYPPADYEKCRLKTCDVLTTEHGTNTCGGATIVGVGDGDGSETPTGAFAYILSALSEDRFRDVNSCANDINDGTLVDLSSSPKKCDVLCPTDCVIRHTNWLNGVYGAVPMGNRIEDYECGYDAFRDAGIINLKFTTIDFEPNESGSTLLSANVCSVDRSDNGILVGGNIISMSAEEQAACATLLAPLYEEVYGQGTCDISPTQ